MSGDTSIRQSVVQLVSTLAMKMEMVFTKYMLTPPRGFGLSFALGFALIGAFHKKGYRYIWVFSNLLTMPTEKDGDYSRH
jgi:hypothetical protein